MIKFYKISRHIDLKPAKQDLFTELGISAHLNMWIIENNVVSFQDDATPKTNCKLKHGASAERFQSIMERNQASSKYRDLMSARQQLPIFSYKDYILDVIREHNVVVIAGETGCGKSTQIPQFILEVCSCLWNIS